MSIVTKSIILTALIAVAVPTAVEAGDREDARIAIARARTRIEACDRAGINGPPADTQVRARAALDDAQAEFHNHHEDRAMAAAHRASSLLALATAQSRAADAQRWVAIATPQE